MEEALQRAQVPESALSLVLQDLDSGRLRLALQPGKPVNPAWHMGVTVVVLDGSPGVMISSDGTSTAIR